VKTEQSMRSVTLIAEQTGRTLDDVSAELLGKQAMAGILEPDDLVGGYLFLASKLAGDITGQTLHVDRGELMD
jgi:NAD(P)-dependent dehydrogenase (short-subunit alcohol dehydrogenase family)